MLYLLIKRILCLAAFLLCKLLYSGLVYSMLDLPPSLYTPIFAAARIVGWSAHRLEELKNADKIIRPAYKPLAPHREYIKLDDR